MAKLNTLKRIIPATTTMTACIRYAPVCAGVPCVAVSTTRSSEVSHEARWQTREGKFERISWEEAFDTIASNMQRLIKDYGNESIYLNYGTGTLGGTMTRSGHRENAHRTSDELLRRLP